MSGMGSEDPEMAAERSLNERVRTNLDALSSVGRLVVGTGCLQIGSTSLALHTDFGPDGQDKETNQDYALAWACDSGLEAAEPLLALAIGDGLTSSYRAEWASRLACAVALNVLVDQLRNTRGAGQSSQDHARKAFAEAGQAISEFTSQLAADPARSCPQGQYLSTWNYILRRGLLLQTTLMLAWIQNEVLRVAMIGDGGMLYRDQSPASQSGPTDDVLANPDLDTNQVNALGPNMPEIETFDLCLERSWAGQLLCALYTDGIGRGLQKRGISLLNTAADLLSRGSLNPAREFIQPIVRSGDQAFDDNLTLALLSRE